MKALLIIFTLTISALQAACQLRSDSVSFTNGAVALKGTLTLPAGRGPFPAVLLVSGSGMQDRDETIYRHKPFKTIADTLTAHGLAVLRYDDRGFPADKSLFLNSTFADFAADAAAGVDFLKKHPRINPGQIVVLGHSEGGLVAQQLAAQYPGIAAIVLLAAPGVATTELMTQQNRDLFRSLRYDSVLVEKYLSKFYQPAILAAAATPDTATLHRQLSHYVQQFTGSVSPPEALRFGITPRPEFFVRTFLGQVSVPAMQSFLQVNPAVFFRKIKQPVLALNGDKDLQVEGRMNLSALQKGLQQAGNRQVKTLLLPGLNHLFFRTETGAVAEYATGTQPFDAGALGVIYGFLNELFSRKK